MEKDVKKRRRRTAEERLADLEQKRLEALEKHKQMLARIEEEKRKLAMKKSTRKEAMEQRQRFERALQVLAPEFDFAHCIAILADAHAQGVDLEALQARGTELLETHGKAKRGRRPKAAL